MWHIIKYHSKSLLANRSMIFWCLLFPLVLSTFFSLTLGNISGAFKMETITVAIVENEQYHQNVAFQEMMKELEKGENAYVATTLTSIDEAKQLLKENEIDGILQVNDTISLQVNQSGMKQTMLASIITEFEQKQHQVRQMLEAGASPQTIQTALSSQLNFIEQKKSENSDTISVYFYALMAMTMLLGGYWSMQTSDNQLANHSPVGARNALAPTKRGLQLIIDFLISTLLNIAVQMIVLLYTIGILRVDFGDYIPAVLLVILVGSLAGNSIGVIASAYGTKSFHSNMNILTSITMTCCALSGLMMVQVKYLVQEYIPFLSYINPANMIADALYAQYYYGMDARYFQNILSLIIFSLLCFALAYARLRRKQYASL